MLVLIPPANKHSSPTEYEFRTKEHQAKDLKKSTFIGTEIYLSVFSFHLILTAKNSHCIYAARKEQMNPTDMERFAEMDAKGGKCFFFITVELITIHHCY